jgi:hypothetical protein
MIMGGGWYGRGYGRNWNWWPVMLIFIGIMLLSGWGRNWWVWMVLFFFVLPLVKHLVASGWMNRDQYEKRKRESGDVIIMDKPKRQPHYSVGDDGELVEIYDEDDYIQKPKRREAANDDLEYI